MLSRAEIFDRIENWLWYRIGSPFHHTKERILGTLAYAKFVWQKEAYREWDYAYLYDLLEFKLRRMKNQLGKDDFVVGYESTVKEIQDALDQLDLYNAVEDCTYNDLNTRDVDSVKKSYEVQQEAWDKFHEILKQNAQKWWS